MFRQSLPFLLVTLAAACDVRVEFADGGRGGGSATAGGFATAGGSSTAGGAAAGGAAGGTSGGAAGGTSGGAAGGSTPLVPCSATQPCSVGQCSNGLCAASCQSTANCPADQFCDTQGDHLCHPAQVQTCAAGCLSSQICVNGFCSVTPPATTCDPTMLASGNDGCAPNSLCQDPVGGQNPKCYSLPACAPDKSCPPGVMGATCNDALIPNKSLVCLLGYCRSAGNCPANWVCVKVNSNDVLGVCGSRGFNAPCVQATDCQSNTCSRLFGPFAPGLCQ